jgi:hypothetical protein
MSEAPTPPAPAAETTAPAEEKASGPMRALAVVVALALLFGVLVMFFIVTNPDNLPLCEDVASGDAQLGSTFECLEGSEGQYTATRIAAGLAGVLGGLAALLGFYVGATGRRGAIMVKLTGAAILLGGITFLIGEL